MFDKKVVHVFNEMETEYDELRDLWYAWLFSRLHFFIGKHIISKWKTVPSVLDIGCGTGFQSFLYAHYGAEVTGIDISDRLVAVARQKASAFSSGSDLELFEPCFPFVERYHRKIGQFQPSGVTQRAYKVPRFLLGDAVSLEFEDESFDHVNCCGSTLSFVSDHQKAIREIQRVLKPGGTFVLEVEGKYNMDLVWTLLDSTVFFGKLEYETTFGEARQLALGALQDHVEVEYPFGDPKNPVYMDLKLFSKRKLLRELKKEGLQVTTLRSVHSLTNLIPSTKLDAPNPSAFMRRTFGLLSRMEETLPFYVPGCSMVLMGRRSNR